MKTEIEQNLEEFLQNINRLWYDRYEPSGRQIINLEIFVAKKDKVFFFENHKTFLHILRKQVDCLNSLIIFYEQFGIEFSPMLKVWDYDDYFIKTLLKELNEGKISREKYERLIKKYDASVNGDELKKRVLDIKMLYYENQESLVSPTIYCGMFTYFGRDNDGGVFDGAAAQSEPFFALNLENDSLKLLFWHELNHCLGAKHSKIPFTLMFPYQELQSKILLPVTKRQIRKTIKEKYSEVYKIVWSK